MDVTGNKPRSKVRPATSNATANIAPTFTACGVPVLMLRPEDAAKALAISARMLWELTKAGEIPCVRVGRAVRYEVTALQAYIERLKQRQSVELASCRKDGDGLRVAAG